MSNRPELNTSGLNVVDLLVENNRYKAALLDICGLHPDYGYDACARIAFAALEGKPRIVVEEECCETCTGKCLEITDDEETII